MYKLKEEAEEKKELIWVPESVANKYKTLETDELKKRLIEEVIDTTITNMKGDLRELDEDIIQFRGLLISYKQKYKEVLESHRESVYTIWEEIDEQLPSCTKKATQLANQITEEINSPLKKALEFTKEIGDSIRNINTYQLGQMVELINKIESLNDSSKEVLLKVLEVGKEK